MTAARALSIRAAADDAGDRPAVITATAVVSFAELAARAAAVPVTASDSAAPVVATPSLDTLAEILAHVDRGRAVALLHPRVDAGERARQAALAAARPVAAGTLAVVFTSGSTGQARGVVLSRAGFLAAAHASAEHLGWRGDDRWLLALPLAHVGGLAVALRCLVARRPVVLLEGDFAADRAAALLAAGAATLASLVPTQLDALLADSGWRPPPHLRAVLLGGAAAPAGLLDRAAARGVPFLATYGMTETWGQVATQPLASAGRRAALAPLPGVTLEAGSPGSPAPIRIRTAARATGVLGGPRDASTGWQVTSDLGWLDAAGHLHVTGRADDVIITGGENVHPLEVEAHVAAAPGVAAACVFAVPDARWGQLVAAAVVAAAGFDRAALVAHLAALGPHHRPRRLAIVDALPLGPSGKVDRRAAAARYAAVAGELHYP